MTVKAPPYPSHDLVPLKSPLTRSRPHSSTKDWGDDDYSADSLQYAQGARPSAAAIDALVSEVHEEYVWDVAWRLVHPTCRHFNSFWCTLTSPCLSFLLSIKRKIKAKTRRDPIYTDSAVDYINEKFVLLHDKKFICSLTATWRSSSPVLPPLRNRKFNRDLEKYYGKYTKDIKDSFERGTAL